MGLCGSVVGVALVEVRWAEVVHNLLYSFVQQPSLPSAVIPSPSRESDFCRESLMRNCGVWEVDFVSHTGASVSGWSQWLVTVAGRGEQWKEEGRWRKGGKLMYDGDYERQTGLHALT